jgi:hypothetical protein
VLLGVTSAGSGTSVWHHIEALLNMVKNPSVELGSLDAGLYLPLEWQADRDGGQGLPLGATAAHGGAFVHSGALSLYVNVGADQVVSHVRQNVEGQQDHRFYAVGGWFWLVQGAVPRINVENGNLFSARRVLASENKLDAAGTPTVARWQEVLGVGRRDSGQPEGTNFNNWNDIIRWGGGRSALEAYIDDVWTLELPAVEVAVLPATLEQSAVDGFLRIDGTDVATQTLSRLTAERGALEVTVRLGTGPDDAAICPANFEVLRVTSATQVLMRVLRADSELVVEAWSQEILRAPGSPLGVPSTARLAWSASELTFTVNGVAVGPGMLPAPFVEAPNLLVFQAPSAPCQLRVLLPGAQELP